MRQLSERPPPLQYAHRFAVLWRGLAFIVLLTAALLTWYVVWLYDEAAPEEYVAAFGHYRSGAVAKLAFDKTRYWYRDVWRISFPPGTDTVIVPGRGPCSTGPFYTSNHIVPPRRLRIFNRTEWSDDALQINVSGRFALQADGTRQISCSAQALRPARLSFTKYQIRIHYGGDHAPGTRPVDTIDVLPEIEHAEGVEIRGAPASASVAQIHFGDEARIEYSNTVDESKRDILFVVIGSLIALGAAMVLESLRPAVERWARRGAPPPSTS